MALVKYNNNSISAVTATAIPSGSLVPIKTLAASSSATLSFVHGTDGVVLDSTYPIYKFEFINIHSSGDYNTFRIQFSSDGGSSYGLTKTTTLFGAEHDEDNSGGTLAYETGQDLAQSTNYQRLADALGNDDDQSGSGELWLYNPSSTTFVKHFMSRFQYYGNDGEDLTADTYVAGYVNTTNVVNAVKFYLGTGTIDSGKIKLYGIKDS